MAALGGSAARLVGLQHFGLRRAFRDLGKDPIVVKLSPLHVGEWQGLFGVEGLLAASGFTKKCGCTCFTAGKGTFVAQAKVLRKSDLHSCFADASERGVNPRLELGGVSPFCARFDRVLVLAVRLCVALRLQLFLRMRLRLLYLCLRAWPPCCRSVVGVVVFLDVSGSGLPEKSASVLQGRSQGTRWKASCQLVSMLGFCTKCQCFSLICYEGPAFRASPCWLAALRGGAFGAEGSWLL